MKTTKGVVVGGKRQVFTSLLHLFKYKGDDDVDVVHFYSAHIHSIQCSWRLADVLACSQKVSHPEMRLVSAAIGASFRFPF
jgi:hypothetical protein